MCQLHVSISSRDLLWMLPLNMLNFANRRRTHSLSGELKDEDSALNYAQELGLITKQVKCPTCRCYLDNNNRYKIQREGRGKCKIRFQCNKKKCKDKNNQVPVTKGTWFSQANISVRSSLLLAYCFIQKYPYKIAIQETSISSGYSHSESDTDTASATASASEAKRYITTSKETISDYYNYCREVCQWAVETQLHTDQAIGGPGKIVEIDESKFGKRKFHRGRVVEGQWVFGGICRGTREVFLIPLPDNKRDRATLEPIILSHILPGTTVISDCWKAYDHLGAVGFQHLTVNHSLHFVDPDSGAHTNNIEGLWWQIKRQLSATHTRKDKWHLHLTAYMWRQHHRSEDLFATFTSDAAKLYNPNK